MYLVGTQCNSIQQEKIMSFNPEYLLNREFETIQQTYTEKDCILYALGVGMGLDPLDEACLHFVFELGLYRRCLVRWLAGASFPCIVRRTSGYA